MTVVDFNVDPIVSEYFITSSNVMSTRFRANRGMEREKERREREKGKKGCSTLRCAGRINRPLHLLSCNFNKSPSPS